jgi:tetratricopeptide (TPR) repeat protein
MRQHQSLITLAAFAGLLALPAARAEGPEESWVGQQVMARHPGVKFTDRDSDGSERTVKMSDGVAKVLKEEKGRLRLSSPGTEAWADKRDMVLMRDAVAHYTEYLRTNETNSWGWNARGIAWLRQGQPDKALQDFMEANRLSPTDAAILANRGTAYEQKGDYDRAIQDYAEALRLDPEFAGAFFNRGNAWRLKQEFDKALKDYDEAIRLDPKHAQALHNRGNIWQGRRQYDRALADYDEAIRIAPGFTEPLNSKAWLLATCPVAAYRDGKAAVELAARACELIEWKDPNYLDTLAAAHAEAGHFDQAVKFLDKALQDAEAARHHGDRWRARLALYRDKKPYRAP